MWRRFFSYSLRRPSFGFLRKALYLEPLRVWEYDFYNRWAARPRLDVHCLISWSVTFWLKVMVECVNNSQSRQQSRHIKMSGVDVKQPDRFSNASLLSILTRSYSRTTPTTTCNSSTSSTNFNSSSNSNANSSKVSPTPQGRSPPSSRDTDKTSTLLSRLSMTSTPSNLSNSIGLTKRISKGPGSSSYVSNLVWNSPNKKN